MTVLFMSTSNSITTSAVAGTSRSQVLQRVKLDRRAAQAAGDLPVVGRVGHLHLARIGQDRIDPDDRAPRLRRDAQLLALREVFSEAMVGLRGERERVLAEDQEAVVADVGDAGLRVLRHHDAGRDVGAAVLRAVGRDREARDVDVVLDHHLVAGRRRRWSRSARSDCRGRRAPSAGSSCRPPGTPAAPCCASNRRRRPAEIRCRCC